MPVRIDIDKLINNAVIPKEAMNIILCHFMKRMLEERKLGIPRKHHHFKVVSYYESFRLKNRYILVSPKGKALCLLKTQFAKKPKNPV